MDGFVTADPRFWAEPQPASHKKCGYLDDPVFKTKRVKGFVIPRKETIRRGTE